MLKWLLMVSAAHAQEVPELNAQLYRPPIDAERTLWTDDAFTAPDGYYLGRASLNYVRNPLVYVYEDGEQLGLLENAVQMNLLGGYVFKQVRAGIDVPIFLLASGEDGADGSGTGLGDIALDVKGTVLSADKFPVGLALGGRLMLPTLTSDAPVGTPGPSGELQVIGSQNFGPVTVAANLGSRFLPETSLENVDWNDQFFYRLGGGYEIIEGAGASLDIAGQLNYNEPLNNPAGSPAEFLAGGWYRVLDDYVLRAGAGAGMNSGVGSPDARVVVSFAYEPAKIFDRDLDTIVDTDDACPDNPEDFDEYKDTDGCPDPSTAVFFEVVGADGDFVYDAVTTVRTEFGPHEDGATFELPMHPGEYTVEVSAERYDNTSQAIVVPQGDSHTVRVEMAPSFGTVVLRVRGPEGEKLDGRANVGEDTCTVTEGRCTIAADAGPGQLFVRAEGYKTEIVDVAVVAGEEVAVTVRMEPAKAVVTREKIEILEKVFFDTAKTTIQSGSFELLDEVAGILLEYPDIKKIRVEGHTDSRGSARYNMNLSQGRADAVRQYLIDKGVDPERLVSQGFGEDSPIDAASTTAAYEMNRRVEFVILARDGGNGE